MPEIGLWKKITLSVTNTWSMHKCYEIYYDLTLSRLKNIQKIYFNITFISSMLYYKVIDQLQVSDIFFLFSQKKMRGVEL
jgi:hypothetical protein